MATVKSHTYSMTTMYRFVFCIVLCSPALVWTLSNAPYFMPLDEDAQDIGEFVRESSLKQVILAFVVSTGQCLPAWYGNPKWPVESDTKVLAIVKKIRSLGGDVGVSFGGASGAELGHVCETVDQLATAYQLVIDKYNLTYIDLDIEGNAIENPAENRKRFEAVQKLKETAKNRGRKLYVSLTLPTTVVGLNWPGREEVRSAIETQSDLIDCFALMAFDFGAIASSMTAAVTSVMESFHSQLVELLPNLGAEEIYARTGMILMNGRTDQSSELFTQQVFEEMVQYASGHGLARVSFWALNRDRSCPTDRQTGWVASFCSSVKQEPYEFSRIISKFHPGHYDPSHTKAPKPTNPTTVKPTVEPTVGPTPTVPNVVTLPDGTVDCKHPNGQQYFPYPGDCHKYIRCYDGVAHVETCEPGTIYDIVLHLCNWEQEVHRPECH